MSNKLKYDQILPFGDDLRNLLNRTIISDADLNFILKNKGIYTSSNSREYTVPVFSSLIISPSEFDVLKERQKTKEDKRKQRSGTISCNIQGTSLIEILPKINLEDIVDTRYMNYEFKNKKPNFIKISNNHVKLEYVIHRDHGNQSWFEKEKTFTASLEIKLENGGLELTTIGTHTANEAESINNKLSNFIIKDLKSNNYIEKDAQIQKVTMKGLDNNNELIMKFFLNLTTVDIAGFLNYDTLGSVYIEIDNSKSLPKDMEWIESKIEKLKFDGKNIDKIKFIENNKYHQYLKCWSMISKYKFNDIKGIGYCRIKFEFQNIKDKEFEIKIENLVLEDKTKDKRDIEKYIFNIVDDFKLKNYKQIIGKNKDV